MTHNSSRDVIVFASNCANLFDDPVVIGEHQLGAAVLGENFRLKEHALRPKYLRRSPRSVTHSSTGKAGRSDRWRRRAVRVWLERSLSDSR